jgi:PHD/YefM family antitoxin component YafN of YafNO toxin-antitoxin module
MEDEMVTKTIASTEAQNHFGQILDDVVLNNTQYVVKRRGISQVVILSLAGLEQLLSNEDERDKIKGVIRELRPVYRLGDTLAQE